MEFYKRVYWNNLAGGIEELLKNDGTENDGTENDGTENDGTGK